MCLCDEEFINEEFILFIFLTFFSVCSSSLFIFVAQPHINECTEIRQRERDSSKSSVIFCHFYVIVQSFPWTSWYIFDAFLGSIGVCLVE